MKITKIVLSMLMSVILIFGCTACGNKKSTIDSSTTEININSSSQLEKLTENVALFNSNSGAIYTYTLKEFTENINKRTEEQTFDYSKWEKQSLQTQEKTGVQFFSYTYDVLTDGTLVGKIEVCVEKESNYILGINIGVAANDTNTVDTNAVKVALIYSLFGCEPKISNNMIVKIMDRLGSNWNNQKYEMFCYNNSAFDLATKNGMMIIQILPVSNDKIKEFNLPIIDASTPKTDINSSMDTNGNNSKSSTDNQKIYEALCNVITSGGKFDKAVSSVMAVRDVTIIQDETGLYLVTLIGSPYSEYPGLNAYESIAVTYSVESEAGGCSFVSCKGTTEFGQSFNIDYSVWNASLQASQYYN